MIFGIGTDIVEIARIGHLIENPHFIERVYTKNECEILRKHSNPSQWAAGRFAAKEAAAKALHTGIAGCPLDCVETLYDENGTPVIALLNRALLTIKKTGVTKLHISISHEKEYAVATVIAEI